MRNENARSAYKSHIKRTIDFAFIGKRIVMLPQPVKALQNEDVDTVIRKNSDGLVYGVTFVDHKNHCAFSGSSIGKEYGKKCFRISATKAGC